MAKTNLPNFPKVSISILRRMQVGDVVAFDGHKNVSLRASSAISRLPAELDFELKTAGVIDPVNYTTIKVLFVTRLK